jgi:uncharacterized protein YrrD
MEFKQGAEVLSSDGQTVGTLKRVVLDPKTKKVAYLVVEKGFLFTEDKVIPIDFIKKVTEKSIELKADKSKLDKLNKFEETHYVPIDRDTDEPEAFFWYPPLSGMNMGGYPLFPQPVYIEKTARNIPQNYVPLKEGARVITEDGKHIGNVERVIMDEKSERATHLVISSGVLLKEKKLVPTHWLSDVSEDEVHLSVESGFLERLPEFEHGH